MIDGLEAYPRYKPSAVVGLDSIPAHWPAPRLKSVFSEVDLRSGTGGEPLLSLRMQQGLIDHHEAGGKPIPPSALTHYKLTAPGDLVMNRMRAAAGLFGVPPKLGLVSPDYAVLRPRLPVQFEYFLRLFKTPLMMSAFRLESRGLGTGESGFLRLYTERFGMLAVPFPPPDEQAAIVRFLDHADRRIRRYIRAKQKLIKLLEEQKQAIIHEAVTRGLDPSVPMKDSGVAWIGPIPAHWEVKRLKSVASRITSGSRGWARYAADIGPMFLRIGNLTRSSVDLDLDDVVRLNLPEAVVGEAARTRVHPGDVLLSITAYIGSVAVVPAGLGEAFVSQHVSSCRLAAGVEPRWVAYVLLSPIGQTHGSLSMYGGTKQGLSLDDVKNYVLLLPPAYEQRELVRYIEESAHHVDQALAGAKREITLLRELRTRLIADVVTGQLDVRAAAAALPDEPTDDEPLDDADETEDAEDDADDAAADADA